MDITKKVSEISIDKAEKGTDLGNMTTQQIRSDKKKNFTDEEKPTWGKIDISLPEDKIELLSSSLKCINVRSNSLMSPGSGQNYENIENNSFKKKFRDTVRCKKTFSNKLKLLKEEKLDQKYIMELKNEQYRSSLTKRQTLPSWPCIDEFLTKLRDHRVVVVNGGTGCGKTTQLPQYILDDCIAKHEGSQTHIICTQPRRISAILVANRVAEERGEKLGVSVGYQIQLKKEDLKIIIMSATINETIYTNYFNDSIEMQISGATYPVKEFYLENIIEIINLESKQSEQGLRRKSAQEMMISGVPSDFIIYIIEYICTHGPGAILIFLAGWSNISVVKTLMRKHLKVKYELHILHSKIPPEEQAKVFNAAPDGCIIKKYDNNVLYRQKKNNTSN